MASKPEHLLDLCIEAIRAGRDPEGILAEYPEQADRIRPLLSLAKELERLPEPTTSVRGLMAALARVTAEPSAPPATMPSPAPRVGWFRRSALIRAAAMLLAVLLIGWGSVSASASALPGDWLYPIKRLTERATFILTLNPEDKAELRITFSEERLKEAVQKQQRGGGIDKELLQAMLDEARAALDAAPALPVAGRKRVIFRAAHLSEFQKQTLEELKERAAPEERKTLAPFIDECMRMRGCNWMKRVAGNSGDEDAPSSDSSSKTPERNAAGSCERSMCQ